MKIIIALVCILVATWAVIYIYTFLEHKKLIKQQSVQNNNTNNNGSQINNNKSIQSSPKSSPKLTPKLSPKSSPLKSTPLKPPSHNKYNATSRNGSPIKSTPSKPSLHSTQSPLKHTRNGFITTTIEQKTTTTIQCGNIKYTETKFQKTTVSVQSPWSPFTDGLKFGLSQEQGLRPQMENCAEVIDMLLNFGNVNENKNKKGKRKMFSFILFDGHLGQDAARFCTQYLPKFVFDIIGNKKKQKEDDINNEDIRSQSIREAFHKTDREFKDYAYKNQCEAGAVGVYIYYQCDEHGDFMYVANVGDCRAVLCSNGECKILTEEHNVEKNEYERKRCKQFIKNDRINGELSITRAIGDYHECNNHDGDDDEDDNDDKSNPPIYKHKKVDGLICNPHIIKHKLCKQDEFIIVACDGLWDVVDPQNAMKECRRSLRRNADCTIAAQKLVNLAKMKHTTDNVSVMVIGFADKDIKSGQEHIGPKMEVLLRRPSRLRFRKRLSTK